jgi:mannitol/fructose-specific phosphotransferase system IIA component (Ntr-type)
MRESKIRNYRPKFKSPFYPWIHIAGAVGLLFLLSEIGIFPLIIVGCLICFALLWYWFFARDKIWREYTLLHLIERITGEKSTGYLVDEELREIIVQRDDVYENRFEEIIKKGEVIDLLKYFPPNDFAKVIARRLAERLNVSEEKLFKLIKKKSTDSNIVIRPGIAIVSHTISGRDKFDILLVRSKKGIITSDEINPIHAFFTIIASPDQKNFYLHCLMWIVQIAEDPNFEQNWINAKDIDELRKVLLSSWKKSRSEK